MKAYLILEDGTVFTGTSIGAEREVISEIVFNTSMTGYLEVLTDPSYAGQAVVMTYPLIGNYGICREDMESERACLLYTSDAADDGERNQREHGRTLTLSGNYPGSQVTSAAKTPFRIS